MMQTCKSCGTAIAAPRQFCGRACVNRYHKRKFPVGYGAGSRLYNIWRAMQFRCYQPAHAAFERYRAKGVGVCEEWRASYSLFATWALSHGYAADLEIDRIDNAGSYGPNNCRWATRSENHRNRDDNLVPITAFGELKTPIEWSEDLRCAVSYHLLIKRLAKGWHPETAIVVPSQARGPRVYSARMREGYRDLGRALAASDARCKR